MKTTAFVSHSDCSRHDTGWNQLDHQGRLPALMRHVYRDMLTLFEPLLEVEARPASLEDLRLAHSAAHVERVREGVQEAARQGRSLPLEPGPPVSAASWDAAVASVGAVVTGVELVLAGEVRNAFCATRPPGAQAGPDGPAEFCLFNNVAIGALHLVERKGLQGVLVLEWGGGFGAGTAALVAGEPRVRFASVHDAARAGAGAADARVGLPAGAEVGEYLDACERVLEDVLADGWRPEMMLLSLGLDALAADPLGHLGLRSRDYHVLTHWLRERAEQLCSGRVVSVLEGGYAPDEAGRAAVQHLRALAALPPA